MRRRLTTLALVAFTLGVAAWTGGSLGPDGGCPVPSASAAGTEGCCHYNKGVCGCEGGRARCCDGKLSISCRCNPGLTTRQISFDAQPLVRLADVAFAGQDLPEPPSPRLTQFRLGSDTLRFWFRVDCNDGCWNQLGINALPVEVRWLFDPGSGPMVEGPTQTLSLTRDRLSAFVPRPPDQLRQGRWETEVRFDTERLCTRADGKCWFRIEVRK